MKGSTEHSKDTTENQRLSCTGGRGNKKQWLHSYNFILVTLEFLAGKVLLDGRGLFGGKCFQKFGQT